VRWVFASFFLQKDSASLLQDVPFASFPLAGQRKRSRTWLVGFGLHPSPQKKIETLYFQGNFGKISAFPPSLCPQTTPRPVEKSGGDKKKLYDI
jgi:hypothetical protein